MKKSTSLALGLLLSTATLITLSIDSFTSPVFAGGTGGTGGGNNDGGGGIAGINGADGGTPSGSLTTYGGGGGGGGNSFTAPYNTGAGGNGGGGGGGGDGDGGNGGTRDNGGTGDGDTGGNGDNGGGGGGGGSTGTIITQSSTISSEIKGGNGGDGGSGNGTDGFYGGAGGGGGGGDGVVFNPSTSNNTLTNNNSITGGYGGSGGSGFGDQMSGGSGGGGAGVVFNPSTSNNTLTNNDSITGGYGGDNMNPNGGCGGGGAGVLFMMTGNTLINTATIIGGNGGSVQSGSAPGSAGGAGAGGALGGTLETSLGQGGAGVVGASNGNTIIINSGTISGGTSGNNESSDTQIIQADAISFLGDNNRLEIQSGSFITGNVTNAGTIGNTFVLGGATDATFNVSQIGFGEQYQGFNIFEKTGTSTWTIKNNMETLIGTWAVKAGILAIDSSSTDLSNITSLTLGDSVNNTAGTLKLGTDTTITADVTLAGTGGGIIDTNGTTSVISGILSGTTLTKQGTGTLTLTGSNTYTGATRIAGGTLQAGAVNTLPSTTAVSLDNIAGALLNLNGFNQSIGSLAGGGSVGGNVDLGSATLTTGNDNTSTTFSGVISGNGGSIIKKGTGTLTLSGINTYTGSTSITDGTLKLASTGSIATSSGVSLSSGTTFDIIDGNQTIKNLSGTGLVSLGSRNLTLGTNTSTTFAGIISGSGGSITKQGTGTLTLTGNNTYTGATRISEGTLALTGAGSITNSSGVTFSATPSNPTAFFDISGITAATTTIGDLIDLYGGSTVALGSKNLTFGSNNNQTFAGIIQDTGIITGTGGSITKKGTGVQTLTAIQTYTGATNIQAGTIKLASTASISSSSGVSLLAGSTFDITDGNQTIKNLSGTGGLVSLGSRNLTFGTSTSTTYAGTISGTGSLIKQGSGTVTLTTASPSYSGPSVINTGGITITNAKALGTGNITNSAALTLGFSNATFTNAVSGTGTTFVTGTDIILDGANSGFSGVWNISGNAQVSLDANLGTASVFLNGNTSRLAMSGLSPFNRPLSGTGTLLATMATANDAFDFGTNVGRAFIGTVELAQGTFDLSGTNTATLTKATLNLTQGNTTTVGGNPASPQIQTIGNLSLNGGKLVFDGPTPTTPISPDKITTTKLTLNSGAIQVTIPHAENPPEDWNPTAGKDPLLMQDEVEISPIINATSISGHASQLQFLNQDGSVIGPGSNTINIEEGSSTVAVGSFGYTLLSNSTGLSVTYGLAKLALQPNQTTVLAGDNTTETGASDFHAQLTGSGNLEIDATNNISISNANNNYTGTTTVDGGIATLGTNNALGNTTALTIKTGATTNLNGMTQTVGTLTAIGTLDIANGDFTVTNGGNTTAGKLKGAGALKVMGGQLNVSGANNNLTATTGIGTGAEVVITNTVGLGTGAINDNGKLTLTNTNGTFNNPVSGTGLMQITNNSDITLTNTRTHSGGTNVSGSTVTASTDTALGATSGNLGLDNATFKFGSAFNLMRTVTLANDVTIDNSSYTTTMARSISGSGSLTKKGSGRLNVTANSPYNGKITVDAGELKINANIKDAAVTVNKNSILSGNNVIGSLINSGIVAPGNSIGTININNDFNNANGIYECEVNDAGQSDLINVNGIATLGGTLQVIPEAGNYQNGQTYVYTVLTSTNPINTTFNTVAGTSPLFAYSAVYQPNAVQLRMIKNETLSSIVTEGNAGIVARNLDSLQTVSGTLQDAVAGLNALTKTQLISALNEFDVAENATIQEGLAGNFFDFGATLTHTLHDPLERSAPHSFFKNLVNSVKEVKSTLTQLFTPSSKRTKVDEHLDILPVQAQLPQALRSQMGQASVWINTSVKALNKKMQTSPGTLIPELGATTSATQVGIDYQVNQQLLVGVTTGYNHTSYRLSDNNGRGKVNSWQLGVYGSLHVTPEWYVDGFLSYGHNRLKGHRNITFANFKATASQAHHANQVGSILETGYDFALPCNLIATPMASLGLVYLDEAKYTESGAGTIGLDVKGRGRTHLQTKIGGQVAKYILEGDTQLYGFVKLAYTYRKGLGKANAVTANFIGQPTNFTVFAKARPDNMASPGAGLTALFKNDVYVTLGYNGDFGKNIRANEGFIKLGKKVLNIPKFFK